MTKKNLIITLLILVVSVTTIYAAVSTKDKDIVAACPIANGVERNQNLMNQFTASSKSILEDITASTYLTNLGKSYFTMQNDYGAAVFTQTSNTWLGGILFEHTKLPGTLVYSNVASDYSLTSQSRCVGILIPLRELLSEVDLSFPFTNTKDLGEVKENTKGYYYELESEQYLIRISCGDDGTIYDDALVSVKRNV